MVPRGAAGHAFIERSATSEGVRTRATFLNQRLKPMADLRFDDEALISLSPCDPRILVTAFNEAWEYIAPTMTSRIVPDATQAAYGVDGSTLIVDSNGRVEINETVPNTSTCSDPVRERNRR